VGAAVAIASWPRHRRPSQLVSYVAAVVQVAISDDGQVSVPRIDVAVDCGLAVNPDRVRAQMEGAAMMGLSNALYSGITIRQGQIEGNFTDYLVARMDITPETHVYIIGARRRRAASVSPAVPQSRRRFAMRFTPRQASASAVCPLLLRT
jgi:isoquinoline 1-oxidoreductase beta subunit